MMNSSAPVGHQLREWRQRRRMSQLVFACEAEISSKHLSFLETGRAQPSREMLLRLSELLDIPLRERNAMLLSAGFAPMFPQHELNAPELEAARAAVDQVLRGHEPYPALAVDRHWQLLASNRAMTPLLAGVDAQLLSPPVNVLRLSLHPGGLASRIVNLAQWRAHLFARLRRQIEFSADPTLTQLLEELATYPSPAEDARETQISSSVVIPFRLHAGDHVLNFISTTTVFGTPIDITLSELAIESFFPADAQTIEILRSMLPG
jgi:transcriptional regulator with XRE-family HTH domain